MVFGCETENIRMSKRTRTRTEAWGSGEAADSDSESVESNVDNVTQFVILKERCV